MKITILHNNRCGKSRAALKLLEEKGLQPEIRNYLEHPLQEDEIIGILEKLNLSIQEIIRKNEDLWKQNPNYKQLSDKELILLLVQQPKLLQRPIIITSTKAIVARDIERLEEFIENLSELN